MLRKLIFFQTFLLLFTTHLYSAIIIIPQDANTIHEAVNKASSGDVIQLMTDVVHWGGDTLALNDMELTIKGGLGGKTKIVIPDLIEIAGLTSDIPLSYIDSNNSAFNLLNIHIEKPAMYKYHTHTSTDWRPASININGGTFSVINSEIHSCLSATATVNIIDSTYAGYNLRERHHVYPNGTDTIPAIEWHSSGDYIINIINSNVISPNYQSISIANSSKCKVTIQNSYLESGYQADFRNTFPVPGEDVIIIENCHHLIFNAQKSLIKASQGFLPNNSFFHFEGQSGGNALVVDNSEMHINEGTIVGGQGSNADLVADLSSSPPVVYYSIPAGKGGNALVAQNSTITLNNVTLLPGPGGDEDQIGDQIAPRGEDGLEMVLDEFTSVYYETSISEWMLMQ